MSRVLVTGGSGAIGSAICRALLEGETTTVIILDKKPLSWNHPSDKLTVVTGDSTCSELISDVLKKFEINRIIDCVSQSRKSIEVSPREGAKLALQGLTKLLDVVREYGKIQSFVLISNQAVYGRGNQIETEPLSPTNFYGAALMGAEAMVHSYVISYKLPAAIVRLTEGIIETLPENIEKLSDPVNLMTAKNAASAILKILSVAKDGRIYNVGGPQDYELSAVKKMLPTLKLSSLKDHQKKSSLSTERLQKELEFVVETDSDQDFNLPESKTSLTSKASVLLFSEKSTGFFPAVDEFIKVNDVFIAESSPGYDDDQTVKNEIIQRKPTLILWIANPKENIEEYEGGPDVLKKNMNEHLLGPWLVASYCHTMGIKFVFANVENSSSTETGSTSYTAVKNFVKPLLNHFPKIIYLSSSVSTFKEDVGQFVKS